VPDQGVDVGGVDGEPDDVGEGHACSGEDRFEVVEGEPELSGHVAGVLRLPVRVDGVLAAAEKHAAVTFDQLGLVEPQPQRP
jgi:hypothetical protein